jgi:hypothetical protein
MNYYTHHVPLEGDERLEIQVRYRKDSGISWFHGQPYKRGLLIDFTPVKIDDRNGMRCKTFIVGDKRGHIIFLEELKRQSDKKGREVAAFVAANIDRIAAAGIAQDWQQVAFIMREHYA